jgi:hypothetical protein
MRERKKERKKEGKKERKKDDIRVKLPASGSFKHGSKL